MPVPSSNVLPTSVERTLTVAPLGVEVRLGVFLGDVVPKLDLCPGPFRLASARPKEEMGDLSPASCP